MENIFFAFYFVRFYSKFHKRRLEELNCTGLHQFISLFLTLSCVADLEDVVRCTSKFVILFVCFFLQQTEILYSKNMLSYLFTSKTVFSTSTTALIYSYNK